MKQVFGIVPLILSNCPSEEMFVLRAAGLAIEYGYDPATAVAIAQGIADGETGREQPFEQYVAEMKTERTLRRRVAAERSGL